MKQLKVDFDNARFVYNHALDMRIKAYKRRKQKVNYVKLNRHITHLKRTSKYKWLSGSTAAVLTQKLIDLENAFKRFFDKRSNFPNFKKKISSQKIRYCLDPRQIKKKYLAGKFLIVPNLGGLDISWSQLPAGIPKMITISKSASQKYYVSFSCDVDICGLKKTGKSVGLDLGVRDLVVTSDGDHVASPRFSYKFHRKLMLAQRSLSRKAKGSKRFEKQRMRVARIIDLIKFSRRDFIHKLTTDLIRKYDVISIEDLYVAGMLKNHKIARSIIDSNFYEIRRQLSYKSNWHGKELTVIDRWTPTTRKCSDCGIMHIMKLSDRMMSCSCGLSLNRDENAARNIHKAGMVLRGALYRPVAA